MVSHGSLDDSAQPLAGGHEHLLDLAGVAASADIRT
jgi:hypothetical protein